jgi:hypothetical protein
MPISHSWLVADHFSADRDDPVFEHSSTASLLKRETNVSQSNTPTKEIIDRVSIPAELKIALETP